MTLRGATAVTIEGHIPHRSRKISDRSQPPHLHAAFPARPKVSTDTNRCNFDVLLRTLAGRQLWVIRYRGDPAASPAMPPMTPIADQIRHRSETTLSANMRHSHDPGSPPAATTSMALTCRWRSRPQDQKRKSAGGSPGSGGMGQGGQGQMPAIGSPEGGYGNS